jgi:hypothetical protein
MLTTYALGLIPLMGGLGIFFTWWIAKAWFLTTLHDLELYGFLWVFISTVLAFGGLLTGMIYLATAGKKNVMKGVLAILCVLINIPAVFWVLEKQHDIEQRAYVRIYNESNIMVEFVTVTNSLYTEHLGAIAPNDYETGYMYPNYDEFDSGTSEVEPVLLTVVVGDETKKIVLPMLYKGFCHTLVLDSTFQIVDRNH